MTTKYADTFYIIFIKNPFEKEYFTLTTSVWNKVIVENSRKKLYKPNDFFSKKTLKMQDEMRKKLNI